MKFLSITALAFFMAIGVQAQKSSFGVKAGLSLFSVRGDNAPKDATNRQGGLFGLQYTYSSSENFGLTAELNYMAKGFKDEDNTIPGTIKTAKFDYLELPLLANVFFGSTSFRPKLFAGPTIGFLIKGEAELVGGAESDIEDGLASMDLGATGGAGFNYEITPGNHITMDVRYGLSFSEAYEDFDDVKNRGLSINLGFTFPLGSAE